MQRKILLLYPFLLLLIILSCKRKQVTPGVEPLQENYGEILYDNKWKGTLDTGTIDLSRDGKTGLVNAVVFQLWGISPDSLSSSLLIAYYLPPETTEIPEGTFTFRANDFYHFTVNETKDVKYRDGGGFKEHQMSFSLHKVGERRYQIEFSGSAQSKTLSGIFLGNLGSFW